jgi:hypothetical protein
MNRKRKQAQETKVTLEANAQCKHPSSRFDRGYARLEYVQLRIVMSPRARKAGRRRETRDAWRRGNPGSLIHLTLFLAGSWPDELVCWRICMNAETMSRDESALIIDAGLCAPLLAMAEHATCQGDRGARCA